MMDKVQVMIEKIVTMAEQLPPDVLAMLNEYVDKLIEEAKKKEGE